MKRKILIISITLSIIIESVFIYHLFNPKYNKEVLEDIKTIDVFNNKDKAISIMVQDTNSGKWTEATDRSSWPSSTTHGFVGAECTDTDGATLKWEDILTFSLTNHTATLKTKQTVFCTLYFATGEPALNHLKVKGGDTFAGGGQHTTAVDGMYRFKGATVTNNYICFGTTVESTCTANASGNYMYRIIGITSAADSKIGLYANQLKIIRAVPSSTSQKWGSSNTDSSPWGSSQAKIYLNTTWYNATFVTAATKLPDASYWDGMISQHGWYITDQTTYPFTSTTEPQTTILPGATDNRIGLMYATDYINANANSSSNWLFIANGWANNPSVAEWTMTRYGRSNGNYGAWNVYTSGVLDDHYGVSPGFAVRPVFYLQSGVNLTGEGTSTHPYIITTKNNA